MKGLILNNVSGNIGSETRVSMMTNATSDAEALAKASIFQATSEKEAWKALEIR